MANLFEKLLYKPEGRGFDCRLCHWNFSLIISGRTMGQSSTQPLKAAVRRALQNLPLSYANCLEIWEPQPRGTLRACPGLHEDCFTLTFTYTFIVLTYWDLWNFLWNANDALSCTELVNGCLTYLCSLSRHITWKETSTWHLKRRHCSVISYTSDVTVMS